MRSYNLEEKKLFLWKEKLLHTKTRKYKGVKKKLLDILSSEESLSVRKRLFTDYRDQLISSRHGQGWTWTAHFTWLWKFLSLFLIANYPQGSRLRKALLDDIDVSETTLTLEDYRRAAIGLLEEPDFEEAIFIRPQMALGDLKTRIEKLTADSDIEEVLNRLEAIKYGLDCNLYHLLLQKIYKASPVLVCHRLYQLSQKAFEYPDPHQYIEINTLTKALLETFVTDSSYTSIHLNLGAELLVLLSMSDAQYCRQMNITGISHYHLSSKTSADQPQSLCIYLELAANHELRYLSSDGLFEGNMSKTFLKNFLSNHAVDTLFESLETNSPIYLGPYQRKIMDAIAKHSSIKLTDPLEELITSMTKPHVSIFSEDSLRHAMKKELADKLYESLDSQEQKSREARAILTGKPVNRDTPLQMLKDIFISHRDKYPPPQNPLLYSLAKKLCEQLFIDYRQNKEGGYWKENEIGYEMIQLLQRGLINQIRPNTSFQTPAEQESILNPHNYPPIIPVSIREAEYDAITIVLNSGYSDSDLLDSINTVRRERRKVMSRFSQEWILARVSESSPSLLPAAEHRLIHIHFYDHEDWQKLKETCPNTKNSAELLMKQLKELLEICRIKRESMDYEEENAKVREALLLLCQLLQADSLNSAILEEVYNYQLDKLAKFYLTHSLGVELKNEIKECHSRRLIRDEGSVSAMDEEKNPGVTFLDRAEQHLLEAGRFHHSGVLCNFVNEDKESQLAIYYFSLYMKETKPEDWGRAIETLDKLRVYLSEDQYKQWAMRLCKTAPSSVVNGMGIFSPKKTSSPLTRPDVSIKFLPE
ncbi:hypothetical protein Lbir_2730 [Legionella birminghamensis]|uniref:Uncharacterized protein n=1 Tax=Legionella birminghamensis TaxID=28083 RepID=A0A378I8I7_9GAMM|nr:hypothetical protein [Legionella birminghamensis]KTC68128.1 hypothetical protein Lbir_2730 [Legionella birminghamensis]STX31162.1 Uncharacterised protein [Legionella birminghamensis]